MSSGTSVVEARTAALDSSGWGEGFRFFQPRHHAFWVYVVLVYLGAAGFIPYVARQAGAYQSAAVVSIVLFSRYGALFWWFTQRIDRYAHQSRKLIVVAFGWGAFAASSSRPRSWTGWPETAVRAGPVDAPVTAGPTSWPGRAGATTTGSASPAPN